MTTYKREEYDHDLILAKGNDFAHELRMFMVHYLNEVHEGWPPPIAQRYGDELEASLAAILTDVERLRTRLIQRKQRQETEA